jgi:SAM-dependent methyltransferase
MGSDVEKWKIRILNGSLHGSGRSPGTVAREAPRVHRHDAAKAVTRLEIGGSDVVLDLGCGDGYHSRVIASGPIGGVVALDLNLHALRGILRESRVPRNHSAVVCANALTLPFADETFDRVVCSLVLYLLPVREALDELKRVMKPCAKAYVRVPMLSAARAWKACTIPIGLRAKAYGLAHVTSGLLFSVLGRQVPNRLLRRDPWACYVPRARFIRAVQQAGFRIDSIEVDFGHPGLSSIDAWISRA